MKWRIQFILLVAVMGVFVLGGIQLAERGIKRVDGFNDGPVQSFHLTRQENGQLEMTVLGQQYSFRQDVLGEISAPIPSGEANAVTKEWSIAIEHYFGHWMTVISKTLKDRF